MGTQSRHKWGALWGPRMERHLGVSIQMFFQEVLSKKMF